jgi:hypothetical protein
LRMYKGKYSDLIITGRYKKARNKKRYVPPTYAKYLAKMQ